tara:strand:+ start:424 stop:1509 length:1086 start_codon:yes stop_codon:yes gene_type:complete
VNRNQLKVKQKIIFLSQFSSSQGSGVGDYSGLLSDSIQSKSIASTELRSWDESKPNWQRLLNPTTCKNILSIQFVPYSFGRWGFFLPFFRELKKVKDLWNIHIIFHEIWIGDHKFATKKEKLVGKIQKWFILRMIRSVNPIAIHTTNAAYLYRLKTEGVKVKYLPMFGTIPVSSQKKEELNDSNVLKIALFGGCHFGWPWEKLLIQLKKYEKEVDTAVEFYAIGGLGSQWPDIKCMINNSFRFKIYETGFLDQSDISGILKNMDLSVTSTPLDILGKSSSAATLLEHGLPQIVHDDGDTPNAMNWVPDYYMDQIFLLDENPFRFFQNNGIPEKKTPRSGIEKTAEILLADIEKGLATKNQI